MTTQSNIHRILVGVVIILSAFMARASAQAHIIELTADSDSRYKIAGQRTPEITVKAGEQLLLRVTAHRGKTWNRDGSIHGFTLLRAKDRTKVDGRWMGGTCSSSPASRNFSSSFLANRARTKWSVR